MRRQRLAHTVNSFCAASPSGRVAAHAFFTHFVSFRLSFCCSQSALDNFEFALWWRGRSNNGD
jgi:hypothetical protein